MPHVGIDLVFIPQFREKCREASFLSRMFSDNELGIAAGNIEKLAGMYAMKEAYVKASRRAPDWHAIEIEYTGEGAPLIRADTPLEISVSHDGDYAMAVVVAADIIGE